LILPYSTNNGSLYGIFQVLDPLVLKARAALCRWLSKGTFKSRGFQMKSIIPQILLENSSECVPIKVINNLPLQHSSWVPNLLVLFPTKERNFIPENIRIFFPGSRCSFAQKSKNDLFQRGQFYYSLKCNFL
jgi:hypothetical protein